jgi:hypothetical protein
MLFWGSFAINMALLTDLPGSLIPSKTAKNRIGGISSCLPPPRAAEKQNGEAVGRFYKYFTP